MHWELLGGKFFSLKQLQRIGYQEAKQAHGLGDIWMYLRQQHTAHALDDQSMPTIGYSKIVT